MTGKLDSGTALQNSPAISSDILLRIVMGSLIRNLGVAHYRRLDQWSSYVTGKWSSSLHSGTDFSRLPQYPQLSPPSASSVMNCSWLQPWHPCRLVHSLENIRLFLATCCFVRYQFPFHWGESWSRKVYTNSRTQASLVRKHTVDVAAKLQPLGIDLNSRRILLLQVPWRSIYETRSTKDTRYPRKQYNLHEWIERWDHYRKILEGQGEDSTQHENENKSE